MITFECMKLGIISDIHEDTGSLEITLSRLEKQRCDMVICLGDILGYDARHYQYRKARSANDCIRLVRENISLSVAGNHDLFAVQRIPEFRAGFSYPADWYQRTPTDRYRKAGKSLWLYGEEERPDWLDHTSRAYLESLPEYKILSLKGTDMLLTHSIFPDPSGSTTRMPQSAFSLWSHLRMMQKNNCQLGISGHVHIMGTLTGNWLFMHESRRTSFPVGHGRRWITCPPVVLGKVRNGYMLVSLNEMVIEICYLQ